MLTAKRNWGRETGSTYIVAILKPKLAIVIEAGQPARTVVARRHHRLPKRAQHHVDGRLNGRPYLYRLTYGQGRGAVVRFYAYFEALGDIWYVDIGDGYLSEGTEVLFPHDAP